MSRVSSLRVLLHLSIRSLFSHWIKTLIVGGIMFFGTLLLVVGLSLLDSLESAMQRSVTGSVTGHFQVQSAQGQDDLAIFGGQVTGQDIGEILNFAPIKAALSKVENVKAVVPMGTVQVTVFGRNDFDRVLESLRGAVQRKDQEAIDGNKQTLLQLADLLLSDMRNRQAVLSDQEEIAAKIAKVERIKTPEFWAGFAQDPERALRALDTEVAPLASDGQMYYLRTLGTDMPLFANSFDRFELVEGTAVPDGHRGLLLNQGYRERWLKHFVARGFDELKKGLDEGRTIATDDALKTRTNQNQRQSSRILYQLSPKDAAALAVELRTFLDQPPSADLASLLNSFLALDDANFKSRYDFFYKTIAPMIRLYELPLGSTITLRAVTRNGYFKAVNVKVYGIYKFKGLEDSALAGVFNIIDLMSFRDLYGLMTDDQRAELAGLRDEVGVEEVSRDNAEDALFGGAEDSPTPSTTPDPSKPRLSDDPSKVIAAAGIADIDKPFTQQEVDEGLVMHAAIVLKDPELLDETAEALQKSIDDNKLDLKLIDWQSASGLVGQFVTVIRAVLYVAIIIIFLVALIIINNAMLMATMDRIGEIGTMRAIGAQRSFVLLMVMFETLVLGLTAGGAGALVGVGIVYALGSAGISAGGVDVLVFLFSGPRLYPTVGLSQILTGLVVIVFVSLGSTLYPARIATKVQPTEAMRTKE